MDRQRNSSIHEIEKGLSRYLVRRVAGQPKPEVCVVGPTAQPVADLLERRHPRLGQVTVLQHDPVTSRAAALDQRFR